MKQLDLCIDEGTEIGVGGVSIVLNGVCRTDPRQGRPERLRLRLDHKQAKDLHRLILKALDEGMERNWIEAVKEVQSQRQEEGKKDNNKSKKDK